MDKATKFVGIGCLGVVGIFVVIFFISLLVHPPDSESRKSASEPDSAVVAQKYERIREQKRQDSIELAEAKSTYGELVDEFRVKDDEFDDVKFYRHHAFGNNWPAEKTLMAGINSTGYHWIESNYYGDDWLFHESFKIIIGDNNPVTMPTVPRYSDKNRNDIAGGTVYENVQYEDDIDVLGMIAENHKKRIKVRLIGREYHSDFILDYNTKLALKKTYDLAEAIETINEQGEDLPS